MQSKKHHTYCLEAKGGGGFGASKPSQYRSRKLHRVAKVASCRSTQNGRCQAITCLNKMLFSYQNLNLTENQDTVTHTCASTERCLYTHTHLTQGIPEHTHERLRVCRHTTVHKTEDLVPDENIQQVMYTMAALPRAPISKCFKEVPGTPGYIF